MTFTPPAVLDPSKVGTYDLVAGAGGGYVWDAVLEYRVWRHQDDGDELYVFDNHDDAMAFSLISDGAEAPLALVLQEEYLDEVEPGVYEHVVERRITEWSVELLRRPRRTDRTIPDFLASDAPDRLDRLRGLV